MSPPLETPDSKVKPYIYYFRHVFKQRMKYVNKIAFFLAVLFSILFTRHSTWTQKIFALVYEIPIYTIGLHTMKINRVQNSTVVFSDAKSLYWQLLKMVSSSQFWVSGIATVITAVCLIGPFFPQTQVSYYVFSKEYRHKPLVNDQFVYLWFHGVAVGAFYNMQYMVFQRNRLNFSYGIPINPPAKYLFAPMLKLLAISLTFTVVCFLVVPVMYSVMHEPVYRSLWPTLVLFNLDTKSAPLWTFLDLGFLLRVAWYTWLVFFVLEFFNHAFNTYATIGCLHHSRPISSASPSPVITLLSGVRDVQPQDFLSSLSNLCAFQELAYIASSPDSEAHEYRNKIFNGSKSSALSRSFWPSVLDECSLVIKNTCSRVNFRSPSDLSALRSIDLKAPDSDSNSDAYIFGNSTNPKIDPKDSFKETKDTRETRNSPEMNFLPTNFPRETLDSFSESLNDTTNLAISATSSPLKKYDNPQQARLAQMASNPLQSVPESKARTVLLKIVQVLDSYILVPLNNRLVKFAPTHKPLPQNAAHVRTQFSVYYDRLLETKIGYLWRTTLKRDTESRVLNPVNYGNAVLTLSGLLLRSIEEDRSNTISNAYLSEVLNLLEKPIRAFANYTDYLPASVYRPTTKNHLVALMHDLTVKEFYQLAVKFNYKLSDLQLSPRAFKLAKWVVAASIANTDKRTDHTGVYI